MRAPRPAGRVSRPAVRGEAVAALARAELLLSPAAAPRDPYLSAAIRHGHLSPRLALELPRDRLVGARPGPGRTSGSTATSRDSWTTRPPGLPWNCAPAARCSPRSSRNSPSAYPDLRDRTSDLQLASAAFTTATRMKVFMQLRTVQTQGPRADAVRGAEQVLGATRLTHRTVEPLYAMAVATLLGCERPRSARKWADRLLTEATDRGAAHWEGLMAALRSQAALYEGDLVGVEHYARRALRRMPPQAWGVGLGTVYALLLRAFTETRRHGEAAELLSRPVPEMLSEHPRAAVSARQGLSPSGHAPVPGGTRRLPRLRRADGEVGHEPLHDGAVALRGGTGAAGARRTGRGRPPGGGAAVGSDVRRTLPGERNGAACPGRRPGARAAARTPASRR